MLAEGRTPAFIAADIVCTVPKTDGYTVMQGGGTDGTYAFFGMIDSSQDPSLVRLYKYSLADWSQVLVSEPIELAHCNDITYDSVNKRLVISRCTKTDGYLGLNFVDRRRCSSPALRRRPSARAAWPICRRATDTSSAWRVSRP